ncbi:MAG: peptide ABC transporter substrate-binding protein [Bradymonadales bacterium]|nr:MAG: peptide ABC transporter substrate-binding protein [Bradymonadales bacterium]
MKSLFTLLLGALFFQSCTRDAGTLPESIRFSTGVSEFVYTNGAEPEMLDPHRMSAHNAARHAMNLFEGLLSRGPDYDTIIPGLAENWSISDDGMTYRFVLREGLKWSNGEELTLQQVYDSFIRAMNPAIANPYVYWYNDFIVGARELFDNYNSENRSQLLENLGIQITGPRTLEIRIKEPTSYFKYFLSQPNFTIVHPSMYDHQSSAWTDPSAFVSSGAYQLSEWRVGQRLVMVKNPHFYEADQVQIERVVAFPFNDENVVLNMYRRGQIDWTDNNLISPSLVPTLKDREDFTVHPALGTYFFLFNTEKEIFKDPRVRKALSLVVDREQITDRVLRSGVVPTDRVIPPVIETFQSTIEGYSSDMQARVEEARRLMAEAGFTAEKPFPSFTIRYNTSDQHHRIAQSLQQMWRRSLDLDVRLENMEWKVFLAEQDAGNYEVGRFGWIGDYPDPLTFFELFQTGNENNRSKFSNEEYDRLVLEAKSMRDGPARLAKLQRAEEILFEQAPGFGVYHYVWYFLLNPQVEGLVPNPQGHYQWRYFRKNELAGSASLR